jgi:multidrug efflux system outer membrane protein
MTVLRSTLLAALVQAMGWAAPPMLPAQAGDSVPVVTLEEARRRAATVDPAAVAARGDVRTAGWERRAALANLFTPHLTAATNYIRFSEPFFNFGTGDISPNATSATVEASYTLLGAGKLAELRRARSSVASAEASEAATRFRTALAADVAYYAVLAESELSQVAADRLQRASEQLGVSRVRVQAGEAIATDSLQLLLELNRAQLEVLQRDSALAVSRLRLGRQIGSSGPTDAAPVDTAPPPPLPVTLEEAVAELRARGPELAALRAAEQSAGAALAVERAEYFPDVILSATAGAYDSEFFPSALKRSQLAFTVSFPVWDAGQRELAVARASAQRDTARAVREDRERGTGEDMAQAYKGYETARAGIELALVGVSASTENYRVQGARYREGATTILDLLEAQVGLGEAEAALVQARYAARLALAQIEALLGRRLFDGRN